jgi:hypothetical protein
MRSIRPGLSGADFFMPPAKDRFGPAKSAVARQIRPANDSRPVS